MEAFKPFGTIDGAAIAPSNRGFGKCLGNAFLSVKRSSCNRFGFLMFEFPCVCQDSFDSPTINPSSGHYKVFVYQKLKYKMFLL